MTSHVRVLAVLQIVYASLGLLLGVFVLLFFGGLAAIIGFNAPAGDSIVAVPVLTLIGGLASSVLILLSLPRLIAGIGLLKYQQWARILTFVVSVLGLVDVPVGTALGIYAFWVLTHRDATPLFDEAPAPAMPRT
jgi:hypothetical protein